MDLPHSSPPIDYLSEDPFCLLPPPPPPSSELPESLERRREAIIKLLLTGQNGLVVSVWAPRLHPLARGTARLRAYTQEYVHLHDPEDAAAFFGQESSLLSSFCSPSSTSPMIREIQAYSQTRLLQVLDDLHLCNYRQAAGIRVRVTQDGRLDYVHIQFIGVYCENILLELICAEKLLENIDEGCLVEMTTSSEPFEARIVPDSPQIDSPSNIAQLQSPPPPRARETNKSAAHPRKIKAWTQIDGEAIYAAMKRKHTTSNFLCMMCKTTSTPQRRCAV